MTLAHLRPGVCITVLDDGAVRITEPWTSDVTWPAGSAEAKDYRRAIGENVLKVEQVDRDTRATTYESEMVRD